MSEFKELQPNEIEWRIQSTTKDKSKTVVVPYLQNRAVMNRFDEMFGSMYWKNEYQQWRNKGVICGISVYNKELKEWITKFDGADETNIEATKGGLSDSMKRCAVQWGLGRDLYDYPKVMLEGELRYIPAWAKKRLEDLTNAYLTNRIDREVYVLKQPKT